MARSSAATTGSCWQPVSARNSTRNLLSLVSLAAVFAERLLCDHRYYPYRAELMSEDCLFINIHTPAGAASSPMRPRAVMLWIHGGGYTGGAGSFYNASLLAANNDVIVATINCERTSGGLPSIVP